MLNAILQLLLRNHDSDVSRDIEKNVYVDNILCLVKRMLFAILEL